MLSNLKLGLQVEWAGAEPQQGTEKGLSVVIIFLPRPCHGGGNTATGSAEQVMLQEQKMHKLRAQFW